MTSEFTVFRPTTSRAERLLEEFAEATRSELSSAAGLAAALRHIATAYDDTNSGTVSTQLLEKLAIELTGRFAIQLQQQTSDLICLD